MPTLDDVIALYQDYHWPDELRLMNKLASQVKDGVIVAIGSYRGQMDCALALDATVPVYAVDARDLGPIGTHYGAVDLPYWMTNVLAMDVADKLRPIALPSLVVASGWDLAIGLLFIDGDHNRVYSDLYSWYPYVLHNGLIAIHDSNFDSVQDAVSHPVAKGRMVEVERADVTVAYRKMNGLHDPLH